MSFSERMGLQPQKKLQIDNVDEYLRTALWNAFSLCLKPSFIPASAPSSYLRDYPSFKLYSLQLWSEILKKRIDTIPTNVFNCMVEIRNIHAEWPWNKLFDFIEFNINFLKKNNILNSNKLYTDELNRVLKRESSGYRILNDIVAPITNELEIEEISSAIFKTPFENVNIHLSKSLERLSDKENPDYPTSIKESISGVECICREITGESTLGSSLKKLESAGLVFNEQFKQALEKLYSYSNSKETGIRHALMESSRPPEFEEAKFFLVACSAFVNYLVTKNELSKTN